MKSAIKDLAQFSDRRLFEEVLGGYLSDSSRMRWTWRMRLAVSSRTSTIALGKFFPASPKRRQPKVLLLIDVVRCPRDQSDAQGRTLGYFHSHFAKRIYSKLCSWHFAGFEDMCEAIERECQEFYLDGPNDVDWIFPNSLSIEREKEIYVDYVKDVTTEEGPRFWNCHGRRVHSWACMFFLNRLKWPELSIKSERPRPTAWLSSRTFGESS